MAEGTKLLYHAFSQIRDLYLRPDGSSDGSANEEDQ